MLLTILDIIRSRQLCRQYCARRSLPRTNPHQAKIRQRFSPAGKQEQTIDRHAIRPRQSRAAGLTMHPLVTNSRMLEQSILDEPSASCGAELAAPVRRGVMK